MKERPILFSTEMVKAIIAGKKTVTRRILKPQPEQKIMGGGPFDAMKILGISDDPLGWTWKGTRFMPWPKFLEDYSCPYGRIGDALWVKETFALVDCFPEPDCFGKYLYKSMGDTPKKWKPSLFMPKDAARIWLKIVDIKVKRIKDMGVEDAIKEGVSKANDDGYWVNYAGHIHGNALATNPLTSFQTLWQSINGKESWNDNPFVWVIEFEKLNSEPNAKECDATGLNQG